MYTFFGRETELAELNDRFIGPRSEFFIIYGRRRVGKSELINEFIRQNTGLRIQVREGSRKYQLEQFAEAFSEFFDDPFIGKNGFTSWDSVFEYLSTLIDLDIIWKELPAFEDERSRKGRYFFRDNLFSFWFRFIFPNLERAESGSAEQVMSESIIPYLSQYTGSLFERMIIDLLFYLNSVGKLPFPCIFSSMKRWWHKGEEIDIVGISETDSTVLFCEVKWQDDVDGKKVAFDMKQKASLINWKEKERNEMFMVIARSFSSVGDGEHVVYMDLDMLEKLVHL